MSGMKRSIPEPVFEAPLRVEIIDQTVVITEPEDCAVSLTADAAEISAMRLLDAADRARKRD